MNTSNRDPRNELIHAIRGEKQYMHLNEIKRVNGIFQNNHVGKQWRRLRKNEIDMLLKNGNNCLPGTTFVDNIYTTLPNEETLNTKLIRNCSFGGNRVIIGRFDNSQVVKIKNQHPFPCGLYNSTFINCILRDGCLVRDTSLLANCFVDEGAIIFGCGQITFYNNTNEGSLCGNMQELPIAVETGGRDTYIFAEQTVEDAAVIAGNRSQVELIQSYEQLVKEYGNKVKLHCNVIGQHANVLNCNNVENVYIGSYATVDSANVTNSTILSGNGKEQTIINGGSFVENSIIQWGVHLESLCIVTGSLMCTHSHADRHGKVIDSIIGPFTGVSEGEVTSSLLGPFVGFHHQSLVIATYWPAGRGNIGYGANVGSNHTGKLPDQELWAGEGTFFGLTTAIKFPSNFTRAPYSLIATGVTTLPQRVEMPFSLINESSETIPGISPAFNEISPGWILGSNLFMVLRNENKFKKRSSAASDRLKYENEIITRPDNIDLMLEARRHLIDASGKAKIKTLKGELIYTSKEVLGLGKNYMTENNRKVGIETYTTFIKLYILRTMLLALNEGLKPTNLFENNNNNNEFSVENSNFSNVLDLTSTLIINNNDNNAGQKYTKRWFLHAQPLYKSEIGTDVNMKSSLMMLNEMNHKIADDVRISKSKDDIRGPKIIDGYESAHESAEDDSVVKLVREDCANMSVMISKYMSNL